MEFDLKKFKFSDGCTMDLEIKGKTVFLHSGDNMVAFKKPYKKSIVSKKSIQLQMHLNRRLKKQIIKLSGPVLVEDLVKAIFDFYKQKITESVWMELLKDGTFLDEWNPRFIANEKQLRAKIKTYGDLLGNHNFVEGANRVRGNLYELSIGS